MAIKDLQPRQGKVDIVIVVSEKGDVKEFEKFGKKGRVCSAKAKDASGEIILSLWNDQIDKVNVGDTIHITNGYVSEFQGEKQLTTGKFGNLEVTGNADKIEEAQEKKEKPIVYTNAPDKISEEMKTPEELSEDPVKDEEYIG